MAKRKYSDSDRDRIVSLLVSEPMLEAAQIADRLGMSPHTARQHMWNLVKAGRVQRELVRWLRRPRMGSTPVYGYSAVPLGAVPAPKPRATGVVRKLISELMSDEKGRTAHQIADTIQKPIDQVTACLAAMCKSGELEREFLGERGSCGHALATYSYNGPHIARRMEPEEVVRSAVENRHPLEMAWL